MTIFLKIPLLGNITGCLAFYLVASLQLYSSESILGEGQIEFSSHLKPFFSKYCTDCHGTERSKGKVTLHDIGDPSKGEDPELWALVQEMLEYQEMPPEDKTQPSESDRKKVLTWINATLAKNKDKEKSSEIKREKSGLNGMELETSPQIKLFFSTYCYKCHGPEKSKGKVTLHDIGKLSSGQNLELWETIHGMLDINEMPPENRTQPDPAERAAVIKWIDEGLRNAIELQIGKASVPLARRLTNFEYQNTMRDLLGFEFNLIDSLPEDPLKPYHFNNSADFMLLGPEQVRQYLEFARKALASAIVDPEKPEVHRHRWTFGPKAPVFAGTPNDEIGVYGGGRESVTAGLPFDTWPKTGEYRIRIVAGGIFPPGYHEVPL
ncbi:MAG: DUF1587 domain-containing protein, partial [Opitutales bacterium]